MNNTEKLKTPPFYRNLSCQLFQNKKDNEVWVLLPSIRNNGYWCLYNSWGGREDFNQFAMRTYPMGFQDKNLYNPHNIQND